MRADNAVFRNNKNGVWFGPYQNTHPVTGNPMSNVSYFTNCTFETNDDYVEHNNLPVEFVGLYMVQGIRFLGCTFHNTATITPLATKGNGINAFDSRFVVDELCTSGTSPCTSYQQSKFKNLNYGINLSGSNSAIANARINNAVFDNNFKGVFLRSANNSAVTNNHFTVGANVFEYSPQPFEHKAYGLYIDTKPLTRKMKLKLLAGLDNADCLSVLI